MVEPESLTSLDKPVTAPQNLVIVGGGIMGSGIAATFLAGGWNVHVMSRSERTRDTLTTRVNDALRQLDVTRKLAGALTIYATLDDIDWSRISFVIEAVAEDLDLKREIFRQIGLLASPGTPLASNTSTFEISSIGRDLNHPERLVGAHFFMPAHLVPLVEIVSGRDGNPAVAEEVCRWMQSLGKKPIRVKKELPGLIANRIQHAMMREALYLMEEGVASAEDVDTAVRFGFGFRFIACGPILQKEMSGWDTNCSAGNALYPHLNHSDHFPPSIERMVAEGRSGMKTLGGLWEWTEERVTSERARIDRLLKAGLKILRDDDER